MKKQQIIRCIFIIVASALLGIGLQFIPNLDKRIVALIGMIAFAALFYLIFATNKKLLSVNANLIIGNIWVLLFPIPYVLTHLWTLSGLGTVLTFVVGSFLGYFLFSAKNNTAKISVLALAIGYFAIFYFWLHPLLLEIGLSLVTYP